MKVRRSFLQLWFDFGKLPELRVSQPPLPLEESPLLLDLPPTSAPAPALVVPLLTPAPTLESYPSKPSPLLKGRDLELEFQARTWLTGLGLHDGASKVTILWNPRMRSTAGYARWPEWHVELNPRLTDFEGQVERTLKHELAHLIAYARANRRRIEPHGEEWRQACAELGIADESARHTLPLPRRKQVRKFVYTCPSCAIHVERVKKFQRHTACLACCKKFNRGQYDSRFQFVLVRAQS